MRCIPAPHALLDPDCLVVLALGTIGRGVEAEIVAVAVLDRHGNRLLHTPIRPTCSIPAQADAPPIEVVWPRLAALLTNRIVVGLHVAADRRLLRQTARRMGATVMYSEWRAVGTLSRRSTERLPTFYPTRTALTEACTALAALRAQARPPTAPISSRHVFWRYLR